MTTIIKRNTTIPTIVTYFKELIGTENKSCFIKVFEGENPFTVDNNLLGEFELNGIPDGEKRIEIRFDIDANSVLMVKASVMGMNIETNITSKNERNRLGSLEIDRIIKTIQIYRKVEKTEIERLNSKNLLESFCLNMKQEYELNTNKLSKKIIEVCDITLKWMDTNQMAHKDIFDGKLKEISEICRPISNLMNPAKKFTSEYIPLESYCLNMLNILCDEKISYLISEEDKKRIKYECENTLYWLDINKNGERQLFERKLVELKKSCLFNFNFE